MNLIVPIELVDYAVGSNNTGGTVNRYQTGITFDPSDYDGATYYFEIVARNTNTSTDYTVTLHNYTDGVDVATITVPKNTSDKTRFISSSFTPTTGTKKYCLRLPQTSSASQLGVYAARILVYQVNATKTRIQFPLVIYTWGATLPNADSYIDRTTSTSYTQPTAERYAKFLKEANVWADKTSGSPWTFEAILNASDASATAYAELYNTSTSTDVASSVVSTTGTAFTLVSTDFSDSATNWSDGNEFEVKIKSSGTYYAQISKACLYLRLTNLSKYQLYWRVGGYIAATTSAVSQDSWRAKIDINSYTSPTTYFEATGRCADNATGISLMHDTTNDSGTTGWTNVANINFNSATKARQRVSATITDGYRYLLYKPTTTANGVVAAGFVVITGTGGVTSTQTQLGQARIQTTSSQTQLGKARIQVASSQTQLGKARIQITTNQTQLGKARIQVISAQTQLGKARIQTTSIQTQLGKARIQTTSTQTQLGKANITSITSKTQTQLGKARIQVTSSQTQLGKARIQVTSTQTQLGRAKISVISSQTQLGKARIQVTTSQTQPGKADIQATSTQTQLGKARILVPSVSAIKWTYNPFTGKLDAY